MIGPLERFDRLCGACKQIIAPGEVRESHHTNYYSPESTIVVHKNCHVQIHHTKMFLSLRAPEGQSADFYGKTGGPVRPRPSKSYHTAYGTLKPRILKLFARGASAREVVDSIGSGRSYIYDLQKKIRSAGEPKT